MKKNILIVVLLSVVFLAGCAGMKMVDNPPVKIVLDVSGKTQNQLYSSAKSWLVESHAGIIADADKDTGRIIGYGSVRDSMEQDKFTLRMDAQNGKLIMTFSDFHFIPWDRSIGASHGIYIQHNLDKANAVAHQLSDDLFKYATKQSASDQR